MSNLIVVTGSPGSGKSCVAAKLAKLLYQKEHKPVILLSPDTCVPVMPFLFPRRNQDMYSLGALLEHTDISQGDILKTLVTTKDKNDFGVLGYLRGENVCTYAEPTTTQVQQLMFGLQQLADYVVVDGTSGRENMVTRASMAQANHVVQLIVPDVKSLAYFLSLESDFYDESRTIQVMNRVEGQIPTAEQDLKDFFKRVQITLPHSRQLKEQAMSGTLLEQGVERKFQACLTALVQKVIK